MKNVYNLLWRWGTKNWTSRWRTEHEMKRRKDEKKEE
jgi:hypothetical protein